MIKMETLNDVQIMIKVNNEKDSTPVHPPDLIIPVLDNPQVDLWPLQSEWIYGRVANI